MNMDLLCALVALKDKDTLLFLPKVDIIARCKDKNYVWLANALALSVQGEVPKEDDLLQHLIIILMTTDNTAVCSLRSRER